MTYEELITAAHYSAEYKDGMSAGVEVTKAALTAIGGGAMMMMPGIGVALAGLAGATGTIVEKAMHSNKLKNIEQVENFVQNMQRFTAIANGIIFGLLAQKGIYFQQNTDKTQFLFENQFDVYLKLENCDYKEYILRYIYLSDDEKTSEYLVQNTSKRMVEELMFCPYDKHRKVTVVANCKEVYDFLKQHKQRLSYKGNLTVMYIDEVKVSAVGEDILAIDERVEPALLTII